MMIPKIETDRTNKGCSGKRTVPAITNGELGMRVNPRNKDNRAKITSTPSLCFVKKAVIPSGVNEAGDVR